MNPLLNHQAFLTRRQFFGRSAMGLGTAALAALFNPRYLPLLSLLLALAAIPFTKDAGAQTDTPTTRPDPKARLIDFTDPTYGGRIRQMYNPAGDEHDLYHYRQVFNADNSRLVGIETPKGSTAYQVTLYEATDGF